MWRGFAPILFLIGTIILIGVIAGSNFYYQKNRLSSVKNVITNVLVKPSPSPVIKTYKTQEECESATGESCAILMCDVVPEGKTFEETCGQGFKTGWAPLELNNSLQPSSFPETANWKTYVNKELNFEFKRPPNWSEPQSAYGNTSFPFTFGYTVGNNPIDSKDINKTFWITVGFISQSQLSLMGITYCGANLNDSQRCQRTQIGTINIEIDWGTSQDKTAHVSIPHSNGGIVTFQLNPVNTESKKTLNQILSTFRFE